MKQLLDTHTFLWFVNGSTKLSHRVRQLIEAPTNENLLSIASLWEMSIKYNLGKLKFELSFDAFIRQEVTQSNLQVLNISLEHLNLTATLPLYHRDPFDRLIIAQAIVENLPILSIDDAFDAYSIERIW